MKNRKRNLIAVQALAALAANYGEEEWEVFGRFAVNEAATLAADPSDQQTVAVFDDGSVCYYRAGEGVWEASDSLSAWASPLAYYDPGQNRFWLYGLLASVRP